ncbi:hypothetical protein HZC32_01685 [Candidatus Woesearchaeota archaeon]|nr:hypothetical protein [Candidatus Woesearchaeota archaeon]
MKKLFVLGIVLLLLGGNILVQADEDLFQYCESDQDCTDLQALYNEEVYCDLLQNSCFLKTSTDLTISMENTTNTNGAFMNTSIFDQTQLNLLQERISTLESESSSIQQQINELNSKFSQLDPGSIEQLNTKLTELSDNLQIVNYQQDQAKEELKKEVTKVYSGLAILQTNLSATKSELKKIEAEVSQKNNLMNILLYIFLSIVVISVALGAIYYLNQKQKELRKFEVELTPQIHAYITQQIKKGAKFHQIKEELMKTGWSEEEARWAYKETLKHNYSKFVEKRSVTSKETPTAITFLDTLSEKLKGYDATKVMMVLIVGVLLVMGLTFLIKGISTGKAIYFQTGAELDQEMSNILENKIAKNQFYPLTSFADICVQVNEQDKSASYRLLKTSVGHSIRKAAIPCDQDSERYDFSVRFNNWESFDLIANDFNCQNLLQINKKNKNVIVLPSKYILPGFALNPEKNTNKYCRALKPCLSERELAVMGLSC